MGKVYARESAESGGSYEFAAADSSGRNVDILLRDGFLPLEEEALPEGAEGALREFQSYRRSYRTEQDRVVKYYVLEEDSVSKIESRIAELTTLLSQSDYKIVRSYENSIVGGLSSEEEGLEALHQERELLRAEIRGLRSRLK